MTKIKEDGLAKLKRKDGEDLQVQINKELISESLKLPHPNKAMKIPF